MAMPNFGIAINLKTYGGNNENKTKLYGEG